ncbi:phosphonatase-like hydrolase [Neolewinella lacunae]|uniref:Phosphonatase-like hydrolase n=1 Tax=Neolewinella lacunae TaxID=1517758 RepID=A0A923T895_9BACT|nr:phosphonatase-like hydrolase [Neolewinella lacunae]MBC6994346.1 phosphonatase-like hydrolase [Neolewinella lacunae]MDN3635807.1 phosphonatase-like hydrolase [Neolewinella lacunae]
MTNIQLFVFDMAGTTVNEDNLVYKTLHRAFTNGGFPQLSLADVLEHGAGKEKLQATRDILAAMYPGTPESDATAEDLHARFREMLAEAYAQAVVTAYRGSEAFLAKLRLNGIGVALNTGYDRATAELLLRKMGWAVGQEYDHLVTASDVEEGRPHPAMILRAMELAGVTDPRIVAKVGDSAIDIAEGKNAGCGFTAGVTTGAQTAEQLWRAAPDAVVDGLPALLEVPMLKHCFGE